VSQQESVGDAKRFGTYLRKVREGKRLSLDAVEEMSAGYSERLTKSHLSRIENGLAEPSVRKLFALSQIYAMPLTSLAERFELDLQREQLQIDLEGKSPEEIKEIVAKLNEVGRYTEALLVCSAVVEDLLGAAGDAESETWRRYFRIGVCNALLHLGRYDAAKAAAEELISDAALSLEQRLKALAVFIVSCHRLGRLTVAAMGLEQAEKELRSAVGLERTKAEIAALRGNIACATAREDEALGSYATALEIYDRIPIPFEACKVRINMASAMIGKGQNDSARRQLEAALLVAEASGYDRLRALAMSHLALIAYRRGDLAAAQTWAIRSNTIARPREFATLVFRNCYYLMKVARATGDDGGVKANERTLRSLLAKIDRGLPEADEFRATLAGGES